MKKALLISCFNWYKARLEPIREFLISHEYDVIVLIADYDHIEKLPVQRRYNECTYIPVPRYKSNLSVQRIKSHFSFGKSVERYIEDIKPDLIYLQIPPNNVARYCTKYKKKNQRSRLILDIIDLWPESMPLIKVKNMPLTYVWKEWRNKCVQVADYVFTECNLYQEKLKYVLNADRVSTLYLFKEQTEHEKKLVEKIIKNKETKDKKIKFAYLGSMNNIIDINGICSVIRVFSDWGYEPELYAIGDGENKEVFQTTVDAIGCKTFFYGFVFDEIEKIKILAPCDYAFNMMKDSLEVGLTIKSIDYLSYGLPLINNIKGDTWEMVEKEGIGVNTANLEVTNLLSVKNHFDIMDFFFHKFSKKAYIENISRVKEME